MNIRTRAFTLIEILVYIAILVPISVVVVQMIIGYAVWLNTLTARTVLMETAQDVVERMTREIRQADSLDVVTSVMASSSSKIALTGNSYDVTFSLSSSTLEATINGGAPERLTPANVVVTNFTAFQYDNGETELVRFSFDLTATEEGQSFSNTFYGAAVMRGSYE